jgi:transposase-like protein
MRPPTRRLRPAGSLADVPYRELALALRTESLRAIARRYGVARNTVRYWRQQLAIDALEPAQAPRGPPLQPQIVAYLATQPGGLMTGELAHHFGETSSVLYRALRTLEKTGQVYRTLHQRAGRWNTYVRWHAL